MEYTKELGKWNLRFAANMAVMRLSCLWNIHSVSDRLVSTTKCLFYLQNKNKKHKKTHVIDQVVSASASQTLVASLTPAGVLIFNAFTFIESNQTKNKFFE